MSRHGPFEGDLKKRRLSRKNCPTNCTAPCKWPPIRKSREPRPQNKAYKPTDCGRGGTVVNWAAPATGLAILIRNIGHWFGATVPFKGILAAAGTMIVSGPGQNLRASR